MKNSLMYLFALICSISVFTACSDDEDNSWKQLPQGEITADKIELNLNGKSTTGTVNFTALSLSTAQIEIKDVIEGYSDVTVDMQMEKQPDGSFNLTGTKNIATKPVTRSANTPTPFLIVKVEGTITSDGKLTANISATGTGLYIGTYSESSLVLTYGDTELTGKEVVFDGTDGSNVSILLVDVIPGEQETVLTGIQLDKNGFSGTSTTTNATVQYTGSRADKVLILNLEVTMKDTKGWADTYELADMIKGDETYWGYVRKGLRPPLNKFYELKQFVTENTVLGSSVYTAITHAFPANATRQDSIDACGLTGTYPSLFRGTLGCILPQVLQNITLEKDGNITARYSSDPVVFDISYMLNPAGDDGITPEKVAQLKAGRTWLQSPKNLAFWYVKDGKMYVKLNIGAIVSQSMGGNSGEIAGVISSILNNSDVAQIKQLLKALNMDITTAVANMDDATFELLLDWVKNGIPVKVAVDNGQAHFYLDREVLDPIMKELPALLPLIVKMIPDGYGSPISTIEKFLDCYKYAGKFEIGLDLRN